MYRDNAERQDTSEVDEKLLYDVFKSENMKIINEQIHDESKLKIIQHLYNQCDTLITYKFNLMKNLENERKYIYHEAEQNQNVRSKLQMDKELLQSKVAKYTEHFDQLKVALDVCANNIEGFKKTVRESEDNIAEFKREEKHMKATNQRKINELVQKVEEQKEMNKMEIKRGLLKQQHKQMINLKLQNYDLQERLNKKKEDKCGILEEIKQLYKGTSDFTGEFMQLEEKYQNCQIQFENEKLQYLNIIEKFNTESIVDQEKMTSLELKREHLQSIFDNQNKIMSETQEKYDQLELAVSDFDECVSALKTDIIDLVTQFDEQHSKLLDRITISEQKMSASEAKYKHEEEKNIFLIKKIEEYNNTFKQKCLILEKKRADTQKLRDTLNKMKSQEQEDELKLTTTIHELTTQINNIDKDNQKMIKNYENMQTDMELKAEVLANTTSAKDTSINNYKRFETKSQKKLSKLRQENCKLEDNMAKLESEIVRFKKLATEKHELNNAQYQQKIKLVLDKNEIIQKKCGTTLNKKRKDIEKMIEQTKNMELLISELNTGKKGIQNELDKKVRELLEKTKLDDIDILRDDSQLQIPSSPDANLFDYRADTLNFKPNYKPPKIDTKMTLRRKLYSQRVNIITSDSDSEFSGVLIKDNKDVSLPLPNDASPMFKRPVIRKPTKEVKKRKSRK